MMSVIAFAGALVLAALLSLRGADRALLSGLEKVGFNWQPAIALSTLTGFATAGAAAALGAWLAGTAPGGKWGVAGFAGILALARWLTLPRRRELREPTRSIFAFATVLILLQAFDAVRLMAVALAALTGEPLLVACGAFIGAPVGLAQPERTEVCRKE